MIHPDAIDDGKTQPPSPGLCTIRSQYRNEQTFGITVRSYNVVDKGDDDGAVEGTTKEILSKN